MSQLEVNRETKASLAQYLCSACKTCSTGQHHLQVLGEPVAV